MTATALLIEIVSGPLDGEWVEVAYPGVGVVRYRGRRYLWCVDPDGSRFLKYVGDVTAQIAPLIQTSTCALP